MGSHFKFEIPKALLEDCLNLNEGRLLSFNLESSKENEQHVELIFECVDIESLHVEIKGNPQQIVKKVLSPTEDTQSVFTRKNQGHESQNITDVLHLQEQLNSKLSNTNSGSIQFKETFQELSADEFFEGNGDLDNEEMKQEEHVIQSISPEITTTNESNLVEMGHSGKVQYDNNCILDFGSSDNSFTNPDIKSEVGLQGEDKQFQIQCNEKRDVTSTEVMECTNNSTIDVYSMDDLDEIVISESCKIKKDENGRYRCFMCSKSVLNLFTHIRFMHKDQPDYMKAMKKLKKMFKHSSCKLCCRIFNNAEMLKKHEDIAHKKVKSSVGMMCNICGAILRNNDSLRSHIKLVHTGQDDKFSCEKCDLVFNSKEQLNRHTKHECGLTFSCEDCEFTTTAYKFLLKHMELNHSAGYYVASDCEICSKRLKNVHCLYRHVLTNHKDSPKYKEEVDRLKSLQRVKCPHCSVMLKSRSIKRHVMAVHNKQEQTILKCQECGVLLKNVDTLRSHVKNVHETTGKNFACSICSTTFRTKSNLRYHLTNVHADPNIQYNCEECDYTSSSKKYLKNHYGQTHVTANYMCGECGRTFKTPDKLRRHTTLVHCPYEIKQHICSVCDKEFNVKANLTKHMKTVHLKQYAYKCRVCDQGFQTVNLMKQHYMKKHDFTTSQVSEYLFSSKTKDMQSNTDATTTRENPLAPESTMSLVQVKPSHQYSHNTSADQHSSSSLVQGDKVGLIVDQPVPIASKSLIEGERPVVEYPNYITLEICKTKDETEVMQVETQTVFVEDQGIIMYQEQEVTTLSMDYNQ